MLGKLYIRWLALFFCFPGMVDLVNNVIALPINSRDRVNIGDTTTDFTIALKKSLRNIASLSVAGVVIPRSDTLIGPNNDTLTGAIIVDDSINLFSVSITRTNYTAATLATELQTKLNANTDMLSFGITFVVSYLTVTNRMTITATYPFGATHTWSIQIDFTGLRDIIGIGTSGTTAQTFTASAGLTTLTITCPRSPSLIRSLSYNITSSALTNSVNTSYIASLGKLFNVNSSNNRLTIESQINTQANSVNILAPKIAPGEFESMRIGSSVSITTVGNIMVVGSRAYGVYIFSRTLNTNPWVLMGDGPLRDSLYAYGAQGPSVAISGDGTTIAFTALNRVYVYIRSGNVWIRQFMLPTSRTASWLISLNITGSVLAIGAYSLAVTQIVSIYIRTAGVWTLQQTLTPPASSVKFGSGGVSLSNIGDQLIVGDSSFASAVGHIYLCTAGTWALQQTIVPGDAIGGVVNSVAMSGNGLYVALSSSGDNGGVGATWIYILSTGTWTEQQKIIISSGYPALNTIGDTLIIGSTHTSDGSINIYKRTGTAWTSQLSNYVGTGGSGSNQGASVAISGSGDDVIWGGPADAGLVDAAQGAVWSSDRIGSTWTQVGSKITSNFGPLISSFGSVLAMSDDGNTFAAGFPTQNINDGVVYVYVLNGLTWNIQTILPGPFGLAVRYGANIALNHDGNILAISGHTATPSGGVSIFTRLGTVWTLQAKIVSNTTPILSQGTRLALSAQGDTIVIAGEQDGLLIFTNIGGVWVEKASNLGAGLFASSPISWLDINANGSVIIASSSSRGAIIFKLINNIWVQSGVNFLTIYTPVIGNVLFGYRNSISADGKVIAISDKTDNAGEGATFIFREISDGKWNQETTLIGTPAGNGPDQQGNALALINNGTTCIVSSILYRTGISTSTIPTGAIWIFDYNGSVWIQRAGGEGFKTGYGREVGQSVVGQKTGAKYLLGVPYLTGSGSFRGYVLCFSPAGTTANVSTDIIVPSQSYSVFDIVNVLNGLMESVIVDSNGYSIAFDNTSKLTLTSVVAAPITSNSLRVTASSTFNIARWPSQEYKSSRVSNPMDFSINNDVLKSVVTHGDNADNVIVDNTPDIIYRKFPAGFTIEAGDPIDIQLRSNRDQLIDLNGADWIMTLYATVRS